MTSQPLRDAVEAAVEELIAAIRDLHDAPQLHVMPIKDMADIILEHIEPPYPTVPAEIKELSGVVSHMFERATRHNGNYPWYRPEHFASGYRCIYCGVEMSESWDGDDDDELHDNCDYIKLVKYLDENLKRDQTCKEHDKSRDRIAKEKEGE